MTVGEIVRFRRGYGPQGYLGLYEPGTAGKPRRQSRAFLLKLDEGTARIQMKAKNHAIYSGVPVEWLEADDGDDEE